MVQSFALDTLPSTSRLYADFWNAKTAIRSLVPRHFREPAALAEQAALVDARTYDRRLLCEVLQEQNERLGAGAVVRDGLPRLLNGSSLVAIGGQQAGLFGGPLYTVHKALTILAVARHAEAVLKRPVVPVFWIASEDSDLAEVDHAFVTDRDGRLASLRMPAGVPAKIPVSRIRLGEAIGPLLDELAVFSRKETSPARSWRTCVPPTRREGRTPRRSAHGWRTCSDPSGWRWWTRRTPV